MTLLNVSRSCAIATATIAAILLTSCSSGHAPGDIGRLQKAKSSCPADVAVNAYVAVDGTLTSDDPAIAEGRFDSIRSTVERVAVCSGHVTVVAFGTNSVTTPIYSADIEPQGATEIAQLRGVEDIVTSAMEQVEANYAPAVAALPPGGTDVTGLYRLFSEAQVLRPDLRLEVLGLTDGLTNQGVVIDRALTDEEATSLAGTVTVPDLSGAIVTFEGIGRVVGDPLSSEFIAGLKVFYTQLCERSGAGECLVVTDGR